MRRHEHIHDCGEAARATHSRADRAMILTPSTRPILPDPSPYSPEKRPSVVPLGDNLVMISANRARGDAKCVVAGAVATLSTRFRMRPTDAVSLRPWRVGRDRATVVPLCQSRDMTGTVITRDDADRVAEVIAAGLDQLIDAEFWRFPGDDLLGTARTIERLARQMYAVQVAVAGEIDLARLAQTHGQTSTAVLLRNALGIGPGDAAVRVRTARQVLPQDAISGGEIPP